jgi:small-conductance mechanosensitive channel
MVPAGLYSGCLFLATNTTATGGLRRYLPDPVATLPGIDYLLALLIVLGGWYLSRLVVSLIGRTVAQRFTRPSITRVVLRLIRVGIVIVALATAANQLGFQRGDILLSTAVFSAVIGIVLAPLVGSLINGLFVLADQPYEIGDMIELVEQGRRGYVEDITLRYTKMFTLDNTFIVIPNSGIRERDVINYSAEDERTRLSLRVVVTYESDLATARSLMERAAANVDGVITGGPDIRIGSARYPAAPTCYIETYGDHGVELLLRYWAESPYKLVTLQSAVHDRIWERLSESDVAIAYPHSHLVFDETSGQANVAIDRRSDPESDGRE